MKPTQRYQPVAAAGVADAIAEGHERKEVNGRVAGHRVGVLGARVVPQRLLQNDNHHKKRKA